MRNAFLPSYTVAKTRPSRPGGPADGEDCSAEHPDDLIADLATAPDAVFD